MGGGGGATGDVNYPESTVVHWQEAMQALRDTILDGTGGFTNPYVGLAIDTVPTAIFGTCAKLPCQLMADLLAVDVSIAYGVPANKPGAASLAPSSDYDTRYTGVEPRWVTSLDPQYLDDAADAYSAIVDRDVDKRKGRLEKDALEGGAVLTSAYAIAKGLLEEAGMDNVSKFSSDLALQNAQTQQKLDFEKATKASQVTLEEYKQELTAHGLDLQSHELDQKSYAMDIENAKLTLDADKATAQLKLEQQKLAGHYTTEIQRMIWAADVEKTKFNAEMDVKEGFFDVDKYNMFFKGYSSFTGGMPGEDSKKLTDMQAALGGALSGAGTGAMIGATMTAPAGGSGAPIGAAAGALIGGAAGLMMN